MSHQVNYFATPKDFLLVEERIKRIEPLLILHSLSPTATPRVVPSFEHNTYEGNYWPYFHVVREVDLPLVITDHVPAQGYWSVDEQRSPVIEAGPCFFDGKILARARMYYTDGDYDASGTWVEKSEAFRKWAAKVLRATRKCLPKRESFFYVGADAWRWREEEGGSFEQ